MRIVGDEAALCLAQLRPAAVDRLGGRRAIVGQLHDQQRQLRTEALPPIALPCSEQGWVMHRIAGIGFALVPQHPMQAELAERGDHAVVQGGQPGRRRPRRARWRAQLRRHDAVLPGRIQWQRAAIGELQRTRLRIAQQPATPIGIEHIEHDAVAPGMQVPARHAVATRLVGAVTAAHAVPVDPRLVQLVHRAEQQAGVLRGLRRRQLHAGAVPDHAVEADQLRHAPVVPRAQCRRCGLPGAGRIRLPGLAFAVRMPPGLPQRAPMRCGIHRVACVTRQHIQRRAIVAGSAQCLLADPGLQLRAAPGGVDQAHRHIDGLLQLTREVIAGRRKLLHRLRRGELPCRSATEAALRRRAGLRRHLEHADARVVGIGDLAA